MCIPAATRTNERISRRKYRKNAIRDFPSIDPDKWQGVFEKHEDGVSRNCTMVHCARKREARSSAKQSSSAVQLASEFEKLD